MYLCVYVCVFVRVCVCLCVCSRVSTISRTDHHTYTRMRRDTRRTQRFHTLDLLQPPQLRTASNTVSQGLFVTFSAIIKQYAENVLDTDLQKILLKYDLRENGRFCYSDFLRYFVLTLRSRSRSCSSLLSRKKLDSPKIQVGLPVNSW